MLNIKVIFLLLTMVLLLCTCSENISSPEKFTIKIDLPLNLKSVYANAIYTEENDTLSLNALKMSSIIFTDQTESNDTTYLVADVQEFVPDDFNSSSTESGSLILSLTDRWVSIEDESFITSTFFYKSFTDTTALPTNNFHHNAIYPRILEQGNISDIFKPGNDFSTSMYKRFRVGGEIKWDDSFGYNTGIYLETESSFGEDDTLFTAAIYDEHGMIISQYTLDLIITTTELPEGIDTLRIHTVSRRINDYSNPLLTRELSFYANQVIQNDLTLLYR